MESNKFFFFVAHMSFTTSEVGHWTIAEVASPKNSTHQLRQSSDPKTLPRHCRVIVVRRIFCFHFVFLGTGKTVRGRDLGWSGGLEWRV